MPPKITFSLCSLQGKEKGRTQAQAVSGPPGGSGWLMETLSLTPSHTPPLSKCRGGRQGHSPRGLPCPGCEEGGHRRAANGTWVACGQLPGLEEWVTLYFFHLSGKGDKNFMAGCLATTQGPQPHLSDWSPSNVGEVSSRKTDRSGMPPGQGQRAQDTTGNRGEQAMSQQTTGLQLAQSSGLCAKKTVPLGAGLGASGFQERARSMPERPRLSGPTDPLGLPGKKAKEPSHSDLSGRSLKGEGSPAVPGER